MFVVRWMIFGANRCHSLEYWRQDYIKADVDPRLATGRDCRKSPLSITTMPPKASWFCITSFKLHVAYIVSIALSRAIEATY